jgi:hypothetical protein
MIALYIISGIFTYFGIGILIEIIGDLIEKHSKNK